MALRIIMASMSAGNNKKKDLDFCNRCRVNEPAPDGPVMGTAGPSYSYQRQERENWSKFLVCVCHQAGARGRYVHNNLQESLEGSFRRYVNQDIPNNTPLIKMDINSHAYYLFSQLHSITQPSIICWKMKDAIWIMLKLKGKIILVIDTRWIEF